MRGISCARKGHRSTAFLRGERDKYTWVGVGSSYVLSELLAAVAVEQIQKLARDHAAQDRQAERLFSALAPYRGVVQLPVVPDGLSRPTGTCSPFWSIRRGAIGRCGPSCRGHRRGVSLCAAAFCAVRAKASADMAAVDLPVTDRVAASLIRLPISAAFTDRDCDDVVDGLPSRCSSVWRRAL